MGKYILADNQDLTRFALETLIRQKGNTDIYKVSDKAGLIQLLKEHEDAVVLLDYTLFDFADENQLLIVAERFALSRCANWHSHPASPSRPSQEDLRLANDPNSEQRSSFIKKFIYKEEYERQNSFSDRCQ